MSTNEKEDRVSYERYRRKIIRLEKEIEELRKQQVERLERMYALGLAPFRGYYERLLENEEKNET